MWALLAILVWALFLVVLIWSEVARQPDPWRRQGQAGVPVFSMLPAARGRAFSSFSASLTLHLLMLVCVPYLTRLVPSEPSNRIKARLVPPSEAALILRLPDRVYMVATVAPHSEPRPAPPAEKPRPATPKPRPASQPRVAHRDVPPVPSILLQPNRPVAAEIKSLKLPSFLYRSANQVPAPPRPIDPASTPADRPAVPAQGREVITAPNLEPRPAAISIASLPRATTQPTPMPVSAASGPWALIAHGSGPEDLEGMAQRIVGELVSVGSLSATQSSRRETIEIPPFNQPPGASGGSPNDARSGSQSAEQIASRSAAGTSSTSATSAGTRSDASPTVRILNTRTGPVEVREFSDGSQQWRFSSTGTFDVVIVQHSAGAMIPEAQTLLTGWPVQTVYLALGTAKDWIMQYCLPASASAPAAQSGMLITLSKPAKLEAPFIQLAMIPPPRIINTPQAALFYGTLGADGRFRRLQPVAAPDYATRSELLPYLEQWQFRPAKWDGAFAEVEVVLLVPAASGG